MYFKAFTKKHICTLKHNNYACLHDIWKANFIKATAAKNKVQ